MTVTIRTRIVPPTLQSDTSVQAFRHTIKLGRKMIGEERTKSRQKARRYAQYMRTRSFQKGYEEGLQAAQEQCKAALHALRSCYEDAIHAATSDTQAMATALAERIIGSTLLEHPEVLVAWVHEALQLLKRSKTLHISFHPQYNNIMQQVLAELPEGITAHSDPSLTDSDFFIQADSGGVEFTWRNIITESIPQWPQESSPCK